MCLEDSEHHAENEEYAHVAHHDEWAEDEFIDGLAHEGDEDAAFVSDFETGATEIIQADEDLASAYSTYVEARRKLCEKYRARGFWPVTKGKGKYQKGKGLEKVVLGDGYTPSNLLSPEWWPISPTELWGGRESHKAVVLYGTRNYKDHGSQARFIRR